MCNKKISCQSHKIEDLTSLVYPSYVFQYVFSGHIEIDNIILLSFISIIKEYLLYHGICLINLKL